MTDATITPTSEAAAEVGIDTAARTLSLPTVRAEAGALADAATRDGASHRAFLAELLTSEVEARAARRRDRRIHEAQFPRMKTLAGFDSPPRRSHRRHRRRPAHLTRPAHIS